MSDEESLLNNKSNQKAQDEKSSDKNQFTDFNSVLEENDKSFTKREKKDMTFKVKQMITTANQLFVRNDFNGCIDTLKKILIVEPKNANAYFLLGLVFEETKDDIKAYNFFLIASQLMKTNYTLWEKLYILSTKMNLLSDKLYFIQMLQRRKNSKELVMEKLELYKILKSKYKVLETKIELFYFDGVNFDIFNIIRNETKNKLKIAQFAICLIRYFKQFPKKCGFEFLCDIIRLQFDTGYLYGTRNVIEKYLIDKIVIPRDIRIIYIICVLMNNDHEEVIEVEKNRKNIEDKNFRDFLFDAKESIFKDLKYKEDTFDIYDSLYTSQQKNENNYSKTLNINSILQDSFQKNNLSDIYSIINDTHFWENFTEIKYIKGLLEALISLKMEKEYLKILNLLEENVPELKEFVILSFGNYFYDKKDYDTSLFYFQKILDLNFDNNLVKSKLYEIYKCLGNVDLANKFCAMASLINFVDDIENEDKSKCKSSVEQCNENRILYSRVRLLFKENIDKYLKDVLPLINDFVENKIIFPKYKKYRVIVEERVNEINEKNSRLLSLHGLNADEWSAVLLEFIIANIIKGNLKEATYFLKKSLDCVVFKKRSDVYTQFVCLAIKHSILNNDLSLLSSCFKKTFSTFKDYSWANFYYYLLNFFPDYIVKDSYGNLQRNVRRIFFRNGIFLPEKYNCQSIYKNLDLNLLLGSYFIKNITNKSSRLLTNINFYGSIKDRMTYFIILIITCKSRSNETKNETFKKGLEGLKGLLKDCTKEECCNISYNIGIVYHSLGYVGFAEKYFKEALISRNIELRRMARLNLMIIYRKSNFHMFKKMYEDDETI